MRIGLTIGCLGACLACCGASTAAAQPTIGVSRAVYVERMARTASGEPVRALEPAGSLREGDKVVLMVEWNGADAAPLTVASAVPRALAYQRSSDDAVQVSVDGGRTWGRLGTLRIADGDGTRLASPEDVTHLRWQVAPGTPATRRGRVTYSAIVR